LSTQKITIPVSHSCKGKNAVLFCHIINCN